MSGEKAKGAIGGGRDTWGGYRTYGFVSSPISTGTPQSISLEDGDTQIYLVSTTAIHVAFSTSELSDSDMNTLVSSGDTIKLPANIQLPIGISGKTGINAYVRSQGPAGS